MADPLSKQQKLVTYTWSQGAGSIEHRSKHHLPVLCASRGASDGSKMFKGHHGFFSQKLLKMINRCEWGHYPIVYPIDKLGWMQTLQVS